MIRRGGESGNRNRRPIWGGVFGREIPCMGLAVRPVFGPMTKGATQRGSRAGGHRLRRMVPWLLAWMLLAVSQPARAQWKLVKYEGRDHVTLDSVAQFYGMARAASGSDPGFLLRSGRHSLRGKIGSNELLINGIKFILSYPVASVGGEHVISRMDLSKVIEPVLRPGRIAGADGFSTVVLDAGHGGHDSGARGVFGVEKQMTLDVVYRARDLLTRMGYKVKLTRDGDRFVALEERTRIANQYRDAIFISVHFNAGSSHATGIETFTLAPRGVPSTWQDGPRVSDFHACAGNARDQENMALATASHASMLSRLGMFDRGIKRARFVVIRNIRIPGVLLEGGFVSNPQDASKLATAQYRQQMAVAIADAVRRYKSATAGPATPTLVVRAGMESESGNAARP